MTSEAKENVKIISFTDPACTWCWGSEPVFRAIETHFPGKVNLEFVMGGLAKDAREINDTANGIRSRDLDILNKQVAAHWEEASMRHGMPVRSEGYHLMSDEHPSTYPQNIAYEAAKMTDPEKAELFLYLMRAATAAFAEVTSLRDVQVRIAEAAGIDVADFESHLDDGTAEAAFEKDLMLTAMAGASGFPTFIVQYGDKGIMLNGYQTFDTFARAISQITSDAIEQEKPEQTPDALLAFMGKHPMMAIEEIRQAFDLESKQEALAFVEPLVESGSIALVKAGNGMFAVKTDAL